MEPATGVAPKLETLIVGFYGGFEKSGFPRVRPPADVINVGIMTLHQRPSLFSVELRTAHWAELVEWYRNVLGLRVLVRVVDDGYALFEAGDTRLAILSRPTPGDASPRWSLGFEVVDLEVVYARLTETDADVTEPKIHPEGFSELVTFDPDNNRIRLFSWPVGH